MHFGLQESLHQEIVLARILVPKASPSGGAFFFFQGLEVRLYALSGDEENTGNCSQDSRIPM